MGDAVNEVQRIIQDKEKAIASAQALATDWQGVADRQRAEIEELKGERDKLLSELHWAASIVRDLEGKMQPVNEYVASLEKQLEETQRGGGLACALTRLDEAMRLRDGYNAHIAYLEQEHNTVSLQLDKARKALEICRNRIYDAARWAGTEDALGEHDRRALEAADKVLAPQGRCKRCGAALNNVGRGISVVAGGIRICTPCINPGEVEVARARGLT